MPYKFETKKILLGEYDRRRKLAEEDKKNIVKEYESGLFSQRGLAKKYNVSRSLIQLIVNPERAAAVKKRNKEHWKDYADREKLTESTRKTRRYKQNLYLEGKIWKTKKKFV